MQKRNYTIEDIEKFLEDFEFIWENRIMYNPNKNKYFVSREKHLKNKPIFLRLINKLNKKHMLALTEINNKTFVIRVADSKVDLSSLWQEFLKEKVQRVEA